MHPILAFHYVLGTLLPELNALVIEKLHHIETWTIPRSDWGFRVQSGGGLEEFGHMKIRQFKNITKFLQSIFCSNEVKYVPNNGVSVIIYCPSPNQTEPVEN